MITETQYRALESLIVAYEEAAVGVEHASEFATSNREEDLAKKAYREAGDELWAFVRGLVKWSTPSPTRKSSGSSKKESTRSRSKTGR